jgi:hypothetical protein
MNATPEAEWLARGWERRFIADATRAVELVRLYETLGYETAVEPIGAADVDEKCSDCRLVALGRLVTVYTRRKGASSGA